jgi:hypothetical protein
MARRRLGQHRGPRTVGGRRVARRPSPRAACARVGRPIVAVAVAAAASIGIDLHLDPADVGAAAVVAVLVAPIAPPLSVPTFAAVIATAWWRSRTRRRRDDQAVIGDLPFVVELFRLALGAGLSVHHALPAVATRSRGRLHEALSEVVERERLGVPLADALDHLAELATALRPLTGALVAAERDGLPAGPSLERVAAEARTVHRRRAEEAARRLPVQLLFPLVGCVLPAFALLTVVPVLAASVPHLA